VFALRAKLRNIGHVGDPKIYFAGINSTLVELIVEGRKRCVMLMSAVSYHISR